MTRPVQTILIRVIFAQQLNFQTIWYCCCCCLCYYLRDDDSMSTTWFVQSRCWHGNVVLNPFVTPIISIQLYNARTDAKMPIVFVYECWLIPDWIVYLFVVRTVCIVLLTQFLHFVAKRIQRIECSKSIYFGASKNKMVELASLTHYHNKEPNFTRFPFILYIIDVLFLFVFNLMIFDSSCLLSTQSIQFNWIGLCVLEIY